MWRACQGWSGVFGLSLLAGLAADSVAAAFAAAAEPPTAIPVTATAWVPRLFADVVLDEPELAACFTLSPGTWAAAAPLSALAAPDAIAHAVATQLAGVLGPDAPPRLSIVVAESAAGALAATSSGATTLFVVPAGKPPSPEEAARAVVEALLRAHTQPAAPDERCGEPLMALAEAIAFAGSSSLALLPPSLRPVADWLEREDAAPPLAAFAGEVLDGETPWAQRRARLRQAATRGGASPALLHAAARIVETFGNPRQARQRPFDVLLAWRDDRDKRYPEMPSKLRRALAGPFTAGMPAEKRVDDEKLIAAHALERAVESGAVASAARVAGATLPLRELAAAQARARGTGNACEWLLAGDVPAGRLTGCRGDEKPASYLAALPRAQGGSDVVAATSSGEAVLLRWPRWLLHPLIRRAVGDLVFADEQGIWSVPLDGATAPRLLVAGGFRHLVPAPDGARLAAASWPAGGIVVIDAGGARHDLGASARGGLAWLDDELLVAADDEAAVVSTAGESRRFPIALPCARSIARSGGALLFAAARPCDPGVVTVELGSGEPHRVVTRTDAPLGIVPAGDGFVFGDADGVHRFHAGDTPERVGGGLTPGPG